MEVQLHNIQLRPNGICIYKDIPNKGDRSTLQRDNESNLTRGKWNGYMSPKTRRKVSAYLSTWIESFELVRKHWYHKLPKANKLITFVTLTLPAKQMHTDNEIKRNLLQPFLANICRKYGVRYWYWRAEPQQNGRIHFHVVMDARVHWSKIRAEWNSKLDAYGYIDHYRKRMKAMNIYQYIQLRKPQTHKERQKAIAAWNYGIRTNWSDPNSTDIHRIEHMCNVTGYIIKYMCKSGDEGAEEAVAKQLNNSNATDEEKAIIINQVREVSGYRKIEGRIHGGSDELRALKYPTDVLESGWEDVAKALEVDESIYTWEDDQFTYHSVDTKAYLRQYYPRLFQRYLRYYYQLFRSLYYTQEVRAVIDHRQDKSEIPDGLITGQRLGWNQLSMSFSGSASDWAGSVLERV